MDVLSLTRRENQVVRLLCMGLSDFQIGHRLGISPYTVNGHRTNIYRKLRVTSRTAAVTVYLAHAGRSMLKELAAQAVYPVEVAACEW